MLYLTIWIIFLIYVFIVKKTINRKSYEGTFEFEVFARQVLAFIITLLLTIILLFLN